MHLFATRVSRPHLIPIVLTAALVLTASAAHAAVTSYIASLNGASESPAVPSPGLGLAQVDIDPVAHTMRVQVSFSGLLGSTTASHIHAATAVAGAGNVGVATTTPTFAGFPSGVTSGTYDNTLDMTQASSYNPAYLTANGGSVTTAESTLFQAIADGKAYLNIHTNVYPGGEIRGFLVPGTTPAARATWGRIKSLYR